MFKQVISLFAPELAPYFDLRVLRLIGHPSLWADIDSKQINRWSL